MIGKANETTRIEFHPAADIFPLMTGDDYEQLKSDISKRGLQRDIVLWENKIIDGRNRYQALVDLGLDVEGNLCELQQCDDPVAYVLSHNLYRRHLDTSQRAMVGARARSIYDEEAKERQRSSGGDRTKEAVVEKLPQSVRELPARDKAGAAVKVSGKTIDSATRVLKDGIPDLAKAVDSGTVSVSKAAKIASLPKPEQPKQLEQAKQPKPKQQPKSKGSTQKKRAEKYGRVVLPADPTDEELDVVAVWLDRYDERSFTEKVRTIWESADAIGRDAIRVFVNDQ